MKTQYKNWTIRELLEKINNIDFPEFQREPSVWRLDKKQRLIDSILRDFNISSLYFYQRNDDYFDCIDGRQRINAILSYTGNNTADDEDNRFHLKIENEIYSDGDKFQDVDNRRFNKLSPDRQQQILDYKLNIVIIDEVDSEEEELNLLFLRLQIASILNAGEKLNAMTGEMRDNIFHKIVEYKFFKNLSIPNRRFAKQQVAAQIVLNVFSLRDNDDFHRSRYIDLQEFFKKYRILEKTDKDLLKKITDILNTIDLSVGDKIKIIKNRALAVSFFLFCYINEYSKDQITSFFNFYELLIRTLKWQMKKGYEIDKEYLDLVNFQSNISQAAGERPAIQKRHDFLRKYYDNYNEKGGIIGDEEYTEKKKIEPDDERNQVEL